VTEIGEYDLLYGFNPARTRTYRRLDEYVEAQGSGPGPRRLHTVDDYNLAVGNLAEIIARSAPAAVGLIRIRNGLDAVSQEVNAASTLDDLTEARQPDQIASLEEAIHAWTQGLGVAEPGPIAVVILSDWRLCAWVMLLAANSEKVGLHDFGGSAPQEEPAPRERPWAAWTIPGQLASDRVLDKNLTAEERDGRYRELLKELIAWWCRPDNRTRNQALDEVTLIGKANNRAYQDLNQWISYQVLRRTSKLGIDFVLRHLQAKIYFNMFGWREREATRTQTRRSPGKFGSYLSMFFSVFRRKRDLRIGEAAVNVSVRDLVRDMAEHRYDVPAERSPQPITVTEARYLDELLEREPSLAEGVRIYNE
jgi:hypothetical protein